VVAARWRVWVLAVQAVATALVFVYRGFDLASVVLLAWLCLTAYLVLVHDAR